MFLVKCKELARKQWAFLTRNGISRQRIHAARFASREIAQQLIDANAPDNPEWQFKIVEG
jgi:hypothetical protein